MPRPKASDPLPRQKPGRKGPLQALIPLDDMKRVLARVIERPIAPKPEPKKPS
jgi:hypothetical protein